MSRWVPHLVTASRGVAGPVVLWLMVVVDRPWAAFWLFAVAMLTDLVDGWLARRLDAPPGWGELLDPLSDKILVACAWLGLLARGWAPWWLVWPSLIRDGVVTLIWWRLRQRGITIRASVSGQLMASYEGTALGILLFHGPWLGIHWPSVGVGVGVVGLALSVGSGLAYLASGLRGDDPGRPGSSAVPPPEDTG